MPKRKTRVKGCANRPASTRGNHLEWLKDRGQISDCQYQAGCQIRALFVEKEGRAKSLDLTNDRVDGGGAGDRDFLFVATCDADRKLKDLARSLGVDQAFAVFLVVGLGYPIKHVLEDFETVAPENRTAAWEKRVSKHVGQLVKSGLSHAAFFLGLAARAPERAAGRRLEFWRSVAGHG